MPNLTVSGVLFDNGTLPIQNLIDLKARLSETLLEEGIVLKFESFNPYDLEVEEAQRLVVLTKLQEFFNKVYTLSQDLELNKNKYKWECKDLDSRRHTFEIHRYLCPDIYLGIKRVDKIGMFLCANPHDRFITTTGRDDRERVLKNNFSFERWGKLFSESYLSGKEFSLL